ncbi:MAG: type IV pilus assembly protein PilM, partial [Acidimicrobiia bacterium]|nr:type IV pilus assembly protein PilM [Acidimicrobiia bacterium]
MASRTIGLDIGTNAVRAAEVSFGRGRPVLQRFAQVALPYGAVVGGEVIDPPAVAAALRRLWREGGFKGRSVIVGVANQRVVARIADLPSMPDADLRSALAFQVQDLIPIPVEEAVLDYQVVERLVGEDNEEGLRVLLVAAHRDMLASLLAALDGADLSASRIDLVPFALIRSLHAEGSELAEHVPLEDVGMAEAIIGVGAGVTNVVVHERGTPRFVRTLSTGGSTVAEAIAADFSMEMDAAEDLARRADPLAADPDEARAGQVASASLAPLLEEVRGSLDFYMAQGDGERLRRIVLTGGGSRMTEIDDRLSLLLGTSVEPATPLDAVELGETGLSAETLQWSSDLMAVPIGLALGGEPAHGAVRRISLLPGEITARRSERRQLVGAGVALLVLALLLLSVVLLRNGRVGEAEEAADREEARSTALQSRVAELEPVQALQADIATRRTTVETVLTGDVSFGRVLTQVATGMPSDVWITGFSATKDPAGLAPTGVTFQLSGLDQSKSPGQWLLRLRELDTLTQPWV